MLQVLSDREAEELGGHVVSKLTAVDAQYPFTRYELIALDDLDQEQENREAPHSPQDLLQVVVVLFKSLIDVFDRCGHQGLENDNDAQCVHHLDCPFPAFRGHDRPPDPTERPERLGRLVQIFLHRSDGFPPVFDVFQFHKVHMIFPSVLVVLFP